jgi:o-succinylbenzoate synthase
MNQTPTTFMFKATFFVRTFQFNFKARTSRGLMREKISWFIKLWNTSNPSVAGIGECGPLPGLSMEAGPDFQTHLERIVNSIDSDRLEWDDLQKIVPPEFPSIRFGLETAFLDLKNGGRRVIYENDFLKGVPLPINGLIWMGDLDFMMNQINQKIALGFKCIKLKVGGLDFDRECDVLDYIRKRYFRDNIEIRLDANGAFKLDDALFKLNELAKFNIHSIEQPIKAGLPEMEELCRKSPVKVALDEELIGVSGYDRKVELLKTLKPAYVILKPTLHGGFSGTEEWIRVAESNDVGWWITSALESNIGLNAICQFTGNYQISMPQGLGTGSIYSNNIDSPLKVAKGEIKFEEDCSWGELT